MACQGFLLGCSHNGEYRLQGATEVLELSPEALLAALKVARPQGWQVVGAYHTHPNGNLGPSWRDHRGAVTDWVYVIRGNNNFRAYSRQRDRFIAQTWLEVA